MVIKVCGLKEPENIAGVAGLKPDYIGHIFYKGSPRYFDIATSLFPLDAFSGIKKTAVFVNEDKAVVSQLLNKYKFDAVQFHGNESPEFCASFKDKVTVIKAFGMNDDFDFEDLKPYQDKIDFFLFDTSTPKHGGSGITFNWELLNKYDLDIPFFLSGGLSLGNLEQVKNIKHPQFYGVDLNSKFEVEPGVKDINTLTEAFKLIKSNL